MLIPNATMHRCPGEAHALYVDHMREILETLTAAPLPQGYQGACLRLRFSQPQTRPRGPRRQRHARCSVFATRSGRHRMHRRMVAVVVCLAFVTSGCGARFKDHEESGAPAGAPVASGPAGNVAGPARPSAVARPGRARRRASPPPRSRSGTCCRSPARRPIPVQFDKGVNVYWNYVNARAASTAAKSRWSSRTPSRRPRSARTRPRS